MLPIATLTSMTATGDVITAPGGINVLAEGMPVSCIGDVVAGACCVGAVSSTVSLVIVNGRPVTTLTGAVAGVNPETGIPVATTVVETVGITKIF